MVIFFFFQAEDGIRDLTVTGVQTCALPISVVGEPAEDVGELREVADWRRDANRSFHRVADERGRGRSHAFDRANAGRRLLDEKDRKSTRLNSSHSQISYAVFCLKKKNHTKH